MQKITFPTTNDLNLTGIWNYSKKESARVVILVHGITVDKDEGGVFVSLAEFLSTNGLHVFRFDFRGSGESEGKSEDMTVSKEVEDLESAVKYVQDQGFEKPIILAASFGGSIACLYAEKHQSQIQALCLWNPVLDYDHTFIHPLVPVFKSFAISIPEELKKNGFAFLGRRRFKIGQELWNEMQQLKPYEALQKIQLPTMIIHANTDNFVPYSDSQEYSQNLPNVSLITIHNGEHGFHGEENGEIEAQNATLKFISKF